jgi:two-component system LytT family response regulator
MRLPVLIVDDEAPARRELAFLLRAHPEVDVVAQVGKLAQAEFALRSLRPRIVFLDIHLLNENGFDLIPRLPEDTRVVFVTADDQSAVRAFRANALDYLLKPVDAAALAEAVRRALGTIPADEENHSGERLAGADRVLLRVDGTMRFVAANEIVSIEACGAYTRVHLADGTHPLVLRSLKAWLDLLAAESFMRVHRNALVNLARVDRVTVDGVVELRGGALRLEASRRELPALRGRLAQAGR